MKDATMIAKRKAHDATLAAERRKAGLCPTCGRRACQVVMAMRTMNERR